MENGLFSAVREALFPAQRPLSLTRTDKTVRTTDVTGAQDGTTEWYREAVYREATYLGSIYQECIAGYTYQGVYSQVYHQGTLPTPGYIPPGYLPTPGYIPQGAHTQGCTYGRCTIPRVYIRQVHLPTPGYIPQWCTYQHPGIYHLRKRGP